MRFAGIDGRLDLGAVLDVLGERKMLSVLLECGSELNGAFLKQGLVDKAVLFYACLLYTSGSTTHTACTPMAR